MKLNASGVYTRVVAYQKSNKWAKRTSEIFDTKQRVCKHRTNRFPSFIVVIIPILRFSFSQREFSKTVQSRRLQARCFNSTGTSMSSSVNSTAALYLFSRPGFPSFCYLISNCLIDKPRGTGPVLPMLLCRIPSRLVFACQKLVQHTWFNDFASSAPRFVFNCVFLFSKVSAYSSPKTWRLYTCVFLRKAY